MSEIVVLLQPNSAIQNGAYTPKDWKKSRPCNAWMQVAPATTHHPWKTLTGRRSRRVTRPKLTRRAAPLAGTCPPPSHGRGPVGSAFEGRAPEEGWDFRVWLEHNFFDLDDPEVMSAIAALANLGVQVTYEPQSEGPPPG